MITRNTTETIETYKDGELVERVTNVTEEVDDNPTPMTFSPYWSILPPVQPSGSMTTGTTVSQTAGSIGYQASQILDASIPGD